METIGTIGAEGKKDRLPLLLDGYAGATDSIGDIKILEHDHKFYVYGTTADGRNLAISVEANRRAAEVVLGRYTVAAQAVLKGTLEKKAEGGQ